MHGSSRVHASTKSYQAWLSSPREPSRLSLVRGESEG